MNELAIDVRGLRKSFGARRVVDGLSMTVPIGEICGFLGGNGSGKTTTIRMLCGLLTPDAGEGTCLGLDIIRQAHEVRRQVGYGWLGVAPKRRAVGSGSVNSGQNGSEISDTGFWKSIPEG